MFETSSETDKIDEALAKAQGHIKPAIKDRTNPAFKSSYADLGSVFTACREALAGAGISYTQWPIETDRPNTVRLMTRLAFGGQWLRSTFSIPVGKGDAQGIGSAITYAKRYALAAALGIAAEDDDDGAAASAGYQAPREQRQQAPRQNAQQDNRRDHRSAPQQQQRQAPQERSQGGSNNAGRPDLEAALRQIGDCQNEESVEKLMVVLRGLAWNANEKRVIAGARDERLGFLADRPPPPKGDLEPGSNG